MRPLCSTCGCNPAAVNYRKNGKVHYRSLCDQCDRVSKPKSPLWARAGYEKKSCCDRCGFCSIYKEQFNVFHINGDLKDCRYSNLKTVCANCQRILHVLGHKWRPGDLKPDF